MRYFLFILCFVNSFAFCLTEGERKALYYRLDPLSVQDHLTFFKLYPETDEGKQSLQKAWNLLFPNTPFDQNIIHWQSLENSLTELINLVTSKRTEGLLSEDLDSLYSIRSWAKDLKNRSLKGFTAESEEEVLALAPEEIDLARGLLLNQFKDDPKKWEKILSYEVALDLIALQVAAYTSFEAPPEAKIKALNHFIFEVLGFRFPPHSLYAEQIDTYTFLPSVLDSRRGVCLGVSILYLSLAQRLGLDLEIVTPPGHIYVRYKEGAKEINIETTARGIHIPSKSYLGVNTYRLQKRNLKEVIGLARFNQASVFWQQESYQDAIDAYKEAQSYMGDDPLLLELLAYNYLFAGETREGRMLLKQVAHKPYPDMVFKEPIIEDYLQGRVSIEGLKAIHLPVDQTRESILKKQEAIQKAIQKFPKFRTGYYHLAITYLQLGQEKLAKEALEKYTYFISKNPSAEYYLAILYYERLDYRKAWEHLQKAQKANPYKPSALQQLYTFFLEFSPKPTSIQDR